MVVQAAGGDEKECGGREWASGVERTKVVLDEKEWEHKKKKKETRILFNSFLDSKRRNLLLVAKIQALLKT